MSLVDYTASVLANFADKESLCARVGSKFVTVAVAVAVAGVLEAETNTSVYSNTTSEVWRLFFLMFTCKHLRSFEDY